MKRSLVIGLLSLMPLAGFAQHNLVYNPSFEEYVSCPRRIDPVGQLTIVEGWYQPTGGSADYFNRCGSATCGVPRNKMGVQQPHSGDGYCGIYCNKTEYREYLQTELREPLQAGCTYHLSFYVSLSEYSTCAVATIGGLLTPNRIADTSRQMFSLREKRDIGAGITQTISTYYMPQVQNSVEQPIENWRDWTLVEGDFVAVGGERFLTLGNFVPAARSNITLPDSLTHELTGAYYFIDDVSLTLVSCPPKRKNEQLADNVPGRKGAPSSPAGQNQGQKRLQSERGTNQDSLPSADDSPWSHPDRLVAGSSIILKNIFFEFDESTLLQQSYNELQKVLALLKSHPKMRILIVGHTDNKGSATYNQRLSEQRAQAVVDYLVKKGIARERLQSRGRGAYEPIDLNATAEGRANNRRVEMRILSE